jgi:hypothetical protein
MKKLYNVAAGLMLFASIGTLSAQALVPGPILPSREVSTTQLRSRFANPERATVGEWLFFDSAYESYFVTTPVAGFVNYLFPDSTILTNPSAPFATWTHGVGQAYDLNSPAWIGTSIDDLDFSMPIKIDSILVWGFYNRVNNTTDTLLINLFEPVSGASGNLYDVFYFAGVSANLGVDTAFFLDIAYDQATNKIKNPNWSHKIVLDQAFFADSTADGTHQHVIVPSSPLTVTLNDGGVRQGVFGFTEQFIPGYTHNANVDVIGVDRNGYRPVAAEFNGTDVYPTVTQIGDVTTSYLLPIDVRYNTAGGWNGSMIPMLAYTAPFNWEYVYIVPYISQINNNSLDENDGDINFGIYPNPASVTTNVKVVSNFSGDAVISIYDLSGKVVKQFANFKVEQGNNTFTLDVADLNNGAYIARLESNGHQLSTRLLIAK